MFVQEREKEILEVLRRKKAVTVRDLSRKLYVSEATVRRDLSRMEQSGMLRRSHGGAVLLEGIQEDPAFLVREQENIRAKQMIADKAADFVTAGNTLFLDSSSTVGEVIGLLKQYRFLTVITNGLKNAMRLSQETEAEVYMAGGRINGRSSAALDGDAEEYIGRRFADTVMISCSGIDIKRGITDASVEQSRIKSVMLKNANTRILLCTSNKFSASYICHTADFKDIDYLITDTLPPEEYCRAAEKEGCEIVY